jgi:hypothetical protein
MPHSSVKRKHDIKKVQDPDELRLLKQIVEEAKSFCSNNNTRLL